MKKPLSLRQALTAALDAKHFISQNQGSLLMVATDATMMASGRPGAGFQYVYTLQISLLDFAGDPTEVTIPLLLWLERYQHELLASPEAAAQGIRITFEFLDDSKYDIHVDLKLTEAVAFTPREGGGHDAVFRDEPLPMALEQGSPLHAIFLNGELLLHCTAHPDLGN